MRILVDISHPAHVLFFRNAMAIWRAHGHIVKAMSRDKDITLDLLESFHIPHKVLSKAQTGVVGWATEMLVHTVRLIPEVLTFRPHVMLQIGGTFIGPVAWVTGTPAWAFTDTENATLSNRITFPLVQRVFTPQCYTLDHGAKHRRYPGFHELAYLHPDRFNPDPAVLGTIGLKPGDPFFIVRFVAWKSAHDRDQKGFSDANKCALVSELCRHGKVFVSSEAPLPSALKPYASPIPIELMHHFLFYAALVVGESATMASEAAVLGTPAIFVSPTGRGYTDVQEHTYGLVLNFRDTEQIQALERVKEWVENPRPKKHWQEKRQKLLEESIDVTGWLIKMVENFGRVRDADCAAEWALSQVRLGHRPKG